MSMTAAKTLLVGPGLEEVGGVAIFCKAVLAASDKEMAYFAFPVNLRHRPWVALTIYVEFVRALLMRPRAVVINTSLNARALIRDVGFLLLCRLMRVPVAVIIHGWDEPFEARLIGTARLLFTRLLNSANLILVLGRVFASKLCDMGITCRIEIISTCYPDDAQPQNSSPISQDDAVLRVVYLSRLVAEKGIFLLLDAYDELAAQLSHVELHVAGGGPDESRVRTRVEMSPFAARITLHGTVSGQAKSELLRSATVFCLPTSYGEGMPIALLEALRFQLPIITTRCGGIPDVLQSDVNCVYVNQNDAGQLYSALRALLLNPNRLRQMAQANGIAADHYSPLAVAEKLNKLVASI